MRDCREKNNSWFKCDHDQLLISFRYYTEAEEGDLEEELTVQCEAEVCDVCRGKGRHVNPSIDRNGLMAEDFDAEPGFYDDYTSGVYDVSCNECDGKRVMLVPKEDDPNYMKFCETQDIRNEIDEEAHNEQMMLGGPDCY